MSGLVFLVPIALFLGLLGLGAFLWSMRSGQYDDLEGAARRILLDDEPIGPQAPKNSSSTDPRKETDPHKEQDPD